MRALSIVVVAVLFVIGCSKSDTAKPQQAAQTEETKVEEKLVYYTCPMEMHKHVHSDKPGKCPECDMDLVKVVITSEENKDFYGCPMEAHSHVRSDKPGSCDDCGMILKPMRLEKTM